jgi:hypothetical protein
MDVVWQEHKSDRGVMGTNRWLIVPITPRPDSRVTSTAIKYECESLSLPRLLSEVATLPDGTRRLRYAAPSRMAVHEVLMIGCSKR